MEIRCVAGPDLTAAELYELLRLRAEVFVVEQACAYLDPDGRDLDPATTHLWFAREDGAIAASLRILAADQGWRIGRVVSAPAHRSSGLAARLMTAALDRFDRPLLLDAQSHLVPWYARFGFGVCGDPFEEDGISHTPMRLD